MILILIILVGGVIGVAFGLNRLGGLNFIIHGSKEEPCEELPTWDQAQKIFQENNDTIKQIENIHPGHVFVELRERCLEKGEVVIYYDTIQTRNQIKDLIGESFYGIPYVMYNI